MKKPLITIAVDLTPVLPGGVNGGAKLFVIELLQRLAEMTPQAQFVLLTQASSHDELALLDRPNMRRMMVIDPSLINTIRPHLRGFASRIQLFFPDKIRRVINRLGSRMNTKLKRSASGSKLRGIKIDLLFCPFTAPTFFDPVVPTVCTIYDLQFKSYPEFFTPEDAAHRERTFVEASRKATVLAAISDYTRNDAIAYANLNPCSIRTIYLRMAQRIASDKGIDNDALNRYGLAPQRYLIYPANFWKHKNHEMLLIAFGMACKGGLSEDIKLVCTGSPGMRQEWLISAAKTMNLGDRIVFPGYLPNDELASLMTNCSGIVFPSLYEGFGLPIIEAMALSVPVACSNTSSLPEVAANAAILFDPRVPTQIAQAIVSLVNNEELRDRLIQAGKKRSVEFADSEYMAKEYWELFQYALSNPKYENLLTGAYADGWAGQCLSIQVAPAKHRQTLEIEFLVPKWIPQRRLSVQLLPKGCCQSRRSDVLILKRGANEVLSIPVEPNGGCFEISIKPTFIPATSGHGNDHRELSAMIKRCSITSSGGERIELIPGGFPS